jgi:hypothetical protein
MLKAAEHGILYRPPDNVQNEFSAFPVTMNFAELQGLLATIIANGG